MSTSSYILRASDEELTRLGPIKLIQMLKDCEEDRLTELNRRNEMMKDFNSKLQHNLLELRHLKEVNFQLQKENQELRDDCCSLYDEQMNEKNFVKEWQMLKFTSDKMKSEMLNYQQKLSELEGRQNSLAKENTDLKELCVYLDQERLDQRGAADGSSNSEKEEKATDENNQNNHTSGSNMNVVYEQAFTYIKQLEDYIDKLENSKHNNYGSSRPEKPPEYNAHFADRAKRYFPSPNRSELSPASSYYEKENDRLKPPEKPKAITNAVKVMELQQQMSKPNARTTNSRSTTPLFSQSDDELDEKEKALVREMCNVVMRKLNDTPTSMKAPKSSILL